MWIVVTLLANDSYITVIVAIQREITVLPHMYDFRIIECTTALLCHNWAIIACYLELEILGLLKSSDVTKNREASNHKERSCIHGPQPMINSHVQEQDLTEVVH
jgi:hypothetical protein